MSGPKKRIIAALTTPDESIAAVNKITAGVADAGEVSKLEDSNAKSAAMKPLLTLRMYGIEGRDAHAAHEKIEANQRGSYSFNTYVADAVRFMNEYVLSTGDLPRNMPKERKEN